ncbi:Predicted PurR-regulated permease PerM [Spirosomataceae bacterium TFI 002]|nr:Predicted PurR-regulated permease PerM [Spirosomataceae bacterium TFI 002]
MFKSETNIIKTAGYLLTILLVISLLYVLKAVIIPIAFALIFSITIKPITNMFCRLGLNKTLSVGLTIIIGCSLLVGVVYLFMLQFTSLMDNQEAMQAKLEELNNNVTQMLGKNKVTAQLLQSFKSEMSVGETLSKYSTSILGTMSTSVLFLADLALIPIYSYFFIYYKDFFVAGVVRIFKGLNKKQSLNLIFELQDVVKSYLSGMIRVILILFVMNTVGLLIMGIDNAIFYGLFAACLTIIPYIGIAIGSILPAFMAFITKDSGWYALGVIAWMGIVQFLEGNFITPNVIGNKIKINPFVAIVALLLGAKLWGAFGMILSLPGVAMLKVLATRSHRMKGLAIMLGEFDENPKAKVTSKKVMVAEPS